MEMIIQPRRTLQHLRNIMIIVLLEVIEGGGNVGTVGGGVGVVQDGRQATHHTKNLEANCLCTRQMPKSPLSCLSNKC